MSAQHTPDAGHEIVNTMRNEMQAELNRLFGEFAFLWKYAQDIDLGDSEDRAIFRGRVSVALHLTKLEAMREWLPSAPRDRAGATRAAADEYIRRAANAAATGATK